MRALTATVAGLAAVAIALPAAAAPAGDRVRDPRGDHASFHRGVEAPRASIDIRRATVVRTSVHGRSGTRIRWVIRDVRTLGQGERSGLYQRFVVHTNKGHQDVTFRRDDVVRGTTGGISWTCEAARRHFDDERNVVRLFVPDGCAGRFTAATLEAVVLDDHRLYSRDVTARLPW